MKLHRTGIALTIALSIVPGCHTASVAHHSIRSNVENASSVTEVARKQPSASDSVSQSVENAVENSGPIQQVSAETASLALVSTTQTVNPSKVSLRQAIETALAQNPDLIALRQNDGVGSAVLGVAQTYPFNPWVQVQVTPFQRNILGGSGSVGHYVLLMQQIQLGNQQKFREAAACAALNGIRWNVLQAELLNVAQTERLYFVAVYQQGLRDLADINAENNRQLLDILERQKEAGQATAADVAIVRLDARSTRQQQRISEANLQTALLDLKRHLCLPVDQKISLDKNVMNWDWQPTSAGQIASLAANRPDVMAARSDAESARANVNHANGSRIPDLQIGPYYQRDDFGTTFLGFRAQSDIPVINNGMPLLRQREAEYCQRATVSQQLAFRALLEAEAAADRYERARQLRVEAGVPSTSSIPVELQRLEEQFRANEVDILRVLQARTSLLQSQRADLDALNELMQAAVAVTASTGAPVEVLATIPEAQANSAETQ